MKKPTFLNTIVVLLGISLAVVAFSQVTSGTVEPRADANLDKMRFAYRAFLNRDPSNPAPSTFESNPPQVQYLQTFGSDHEIRPGEHITFTSYIEGTEPRAQAMVNRVLVVRSIQHDVRKLRGLGGSGQVAVILICEPVRPAAATD